MRTSFMTSSSRVVSKGLLFNDISKFRVDACSKIRQTQLLGNTPFG
jgi:hypothetical protein